MSPGPVPTAQPKQSSGVVLTCVFTVLALAGLTYVWYLLGSSAGPNFDFTGNGVEESACPAPLTVLNLSGASAQDCVGSLTRSLARAIIIAVPATVCAAVAVNRWLTHMGIGAKYLRAG